MARKRIEADSSPKRRIVEAAYRILAESGYESTSIKEIARRAGVAPGLVHYYFKSKEELLSAALKEGSDQYTRDLDALRKNYAGRSRESLARAALRVPQARVHDQPEWYRLRYQFFALGLQNPTLGDGVRTLLRSGRSGVRTTLMAATDLPENRALSTAAVLLACFDGLALQKLMDSDFDLDGAFRILAEFVESAIARERN